MTTAFSSRGFRTVGNNREEKVSKTTMNYREGDVSTRHACRYCEMYLHSGDGGCSYVRGSIDPKAVCDAFVRK